MRPLFPFNSDFPPLVISYLPLSVLFKFRADVDESHRETFVKELKALKTLPCVKDERLVVGGPSITDPIARSKGFQICLLSFHHDKAALAAYQASSEHHR